MQREEPYQGLDMMRTSEKPEGAFGNAVTGGAWLSSARVVRCWVKSRNERNPSSVAHLVGHSRETAGDKPEEGVDDVKSSCLTSWATHVLQWADNEMQSCEDKQIP